MRNRNIRRSKIGNRKSRAFTLVELVVVMIVIGVLAAMVVPNFISRIGQSKQSVARQKIGTLSTAVTLFMQDYSQPPNSLDELITRPDYVPEDKWMPSGIQPKDILDPWGNPFVYMVPSEHGGYFDLASYGRDGAPGGTGEDADVTNWEGNE